MKELKRRQEGVKRVDWGRRKELKEKAGQR